MNRTGIEYLTHIWNFFPGCLNPITICATRNTCWARDRAKRFNKGDFAPCFKEEKLLASFPRQPGARIGVCFTGDLFGPWVEDYILKAARMRISNHPEHTFLLLTKNSERLNILSWPDNARVGCTITGAESPERQRDMISHLTRIEGGKRWISYEPMLGPFYWPGFLCNVDWLVIGAQSGPGMVKPKLDWVLEIIEAADKAGVALWLKANLLKLYPELPRRQELP